MSSARGRSRRAGRSDALKPVGGVWTKRSPNRHPWSGSSSRRSPCRGPPVGQPAHRPAHRPAPPSASALLVDNRPTTASRATSRSGIDRVASVLGLPPTPFAEGLGLLHDQRPHPHVHRSPHDASHTTRWAATFTAAPVSASPFVPPAPPRRSASATAGRQRVPRRAAAARFRREFGRGGGRFWMLRPAPRRRPAP